MENLKKILEFIHLIGRLKTTYRFKADEKCIGDSSADHSWRLALMTFLLAEELKLKIDILKAVKIALVHDLAEAITGDIDARLIRQKVFSREKKEAGELEAMKRIRETLPEGLGEEIFFLWEEYEQGKTKESRYIKALDKLETSMHTFEMGSAGFDDDELIGIYGKKEVEAFPQLKDMYALVKKEIREEFDRQGFPWREEYDIK
ncbi:MAG: HD domain-containing protein [Patescibacteria group bacterium]